jgi:hypothetical protein
MQTVPRSECVLTFLCRHNLRGTGVARGVAEEVPLHSLDARINYFVASLHAFSNVILRFTFFIEIYCILNYHSSPYVAFAD